MGFDSINEVAANEVAKQYERCHIKVAHSQEQCLPQSRANASGRAIIQNIIGRRKEDMCLPEASFAGGVSAAV